jgi:hypothetical protein
MSRSNFAGRKVNTIVCRRWQLLSLHWTPGCPQSPRSPSNTWPGSSVHFRYWRTQPCQNQVRPCCRCSNMHHFSSARPWTRVQTAHAGKLPRPIRFAFVHLARHGVSFIGQVTSLRGACEAAELGIIIPVLVGPAAKISAVARQGHLLTASKYPPAEPGALVLEPLKAACPCRSSQASLHSCECLTKCRTAAAW